jgi:hypothetical protein
MLILFIYYNYYINIAEIFQTFKRCYISEISLRYMWNISGIPIHFPGKNYAMSLNQAFCLWIVVTKQYNWRWLVNSF